MSITCDCHAHHGGGFDVVLTADNSLPHLTGDCLVTAVRGFWDCLRPGGVVVIGLRDYRSDEDRASPQVWPYGFRDHDDGRYYVFQTRDWVGDSYDVAMYFVREQTTDSPAKVIAGRSRYHALPVDDLIALLDDVGFEKVERLDGTSHQPMVVASRPQTKASNRQPGPRIDAQVDQLDEGTASYDTGIGDRLRCAP